MFLVLLWKELRSCGLLAAGGALVLLTAPFLCVSLDPERMGARLFDSQDFLATVACVSAGLGVAVGLLQTLPELILGTAAFLAHTSRSRALVAAAKISAGLLMFAAGVFLPTLAGLGWIRSRFTVISAADTACFWIAAFAGVVVYLGILSLFIRGYPWKEGIRQIAGASVLAVALIAVLASPSLGLAAAALSIAAVFAAAWTFTGFAAREF